MPPIADTPVADAQPVAQPTPAATPIVESESLADHEAQYVSGEMPAEPVKVDEAPAAGTERDETGKFKTRHRAKSQEATPDDVPRIAALTKRLRETEAERDALKAKSAAREPEPTRPTPPAETALGASFPPFDAWVDLEANKNKSFDDFLDARSDWRYDVRRTAERAAEATAASERAQQDDLAKYVEQTAAEAFTKDHPDFDDVIAAAPQISKVLEHAAIKAGPRVAYYLATHPEEAAALTEDTLYVSPDNPAFPAAVASMRRYISTLVASSQRSPASAAASTGSAPTRASAAPRPPNPVRTGAWHTADEPPGDGSSLADHERYYVKAARH